MPNLHTSISFGLVNIPVTSNSIIKNNDISFNQLHKKCGSRIKYIKYCSKCKKEVKEDEIIKGYQYERSKYITFTKDELNKLKPEKTGEIEIISFVPVNSVDPIYFEKSYLLSGDGRSKSYNLFCNALKKSKVGAIAKTVISSKFYYCLLRLVDNSLIMNTLYFEEEIKLEEKQQLKLCNEKELDLALKLIDSLKGKFDPKKYVDEYQINIKEAISLKLNGKTVKTSRKKTKQQIDDLMEALEKSLNKK